MAKVIAGCSFLVLWVISGIMLMVLIGLVIVIIEPGWVPLFLYACVGLYCAWKWFLHSAKAHPQPLSELFWTQIVFVLLVALLCFFLGQANVGGFSAELSWVALLPCIFILLMFIRQRFFSSRPVTGNYHQTLLSRLLYGVAGLCLLGAASYVLVAMLGIFLTDRFAGVSLMFSPKNGISWLVMISGFVPGFVLLQLARASRRLRSV